ncbi:RB1-inducible coiled-coil protein 1 isoform X3 [Episyrphus balteatus]|uniref:RB1-inducible coiled-coil protein 1 isoform X3 n=1 Tax=Episyrphus balteatus TaxID=286459 RepID=UPI0024859669|nr:RB1-inducible coiled-coil protein 1 isoform X3 [Episyrphus balteatus]
MLYVFHVDMGRMLKFDMNVALSSVSNLKDTIERLHGISAQNIVLLVSGGEMLTKSTQVSFYSAGTDTNPIYMFLIGDAKLPPAIPAIENDVDLNDQVERCLTLPAVYDTVVTRAQLAQQMYELAREEENICERLVHEQHLQQQGWSAVVANMEDLTEEFRQRFRDFCLSFDRHLEKRAAYIELLNYFSEDLSKLSRIPILPGLMQMAQEDFHGFDELLDNDEVFSRSQQNVSVLMAHDPQSSAGQALDSIESQDDEKRDSTSPNKKPKMGCDDDKGDTMSVTSGGSGTRRTLTLLQWISAKENHNKLTEMSEECIQGLNTFDEAVYEKLKEEVNHIIKSADQSDMKEVKGLSERLCKLEEIKYKIKNMVQDQKELSTAFQQNQNRAINLRDASILPDLCASHRSQLLVMLQNHQKIRELRRCISRAKEELGSNLHTRLKRIIVLENKMSEFDNKQLFYHRCLRRAERHISIIEQIHQAPCIYVAAVTEVIRRKIFSGEFRQWASRLAEDFDSIHSEEINRRRNFNASFEGHFLNILFPGMNDMPPAFANENPLIFDARLPNLTKSDIDILTSYLPDLTHHIQLPDMGPVINFFISRSGNHNSNIKSSSISSTTNKILQTNISGPLNAHHQRVQELQSQSKDGESETDTEEFEKVIQPEMSPTDNTNPHQSTASDNVVYQVAHMATSTEPLQTHTVETLTEENLGSTRLEVERLKSILKAMSEVSQECIKLARVNFQQFKSDQENYQIDLRSEFQNISEKWQLVQMQYESREQDIIEMQAKHSVEVTNLETAINMKDKEILDMRNDQQQKDLRHSEQVSQLEAKCTALEEKYHLLEQQMESLNESLQAANAEKVRAVAEAREKLIHEHKSEIESLRCRYKLMTSMERSPSDTSLEKIEKPADMIELACHETIVSQIREDLRVEKEEAIKQAVDCERSIWEAKALPLPRSLNENNDNNVSVLKLMLDDKERYIDMLRDKTAMLTQDNLDLKTQLSILTNEEVNSWLKEKVDFLNREKARIEKELNMEKSRRTEMEQSFAELRGSAMEASTLPRSKSSGSNHRYVVLESCSKGDIVFVVWSMRHYQFMVVQDSASLYFVNADSLSALNLRLPGPGELEMPSPFYALGRVVHKEYCQARKDENRYRVNKGSKFYRIKLEALSRNESKWTGRRERLESSSSNVSINRSLSQNDSGEPSSLTHLSILREAPSHDTVDLGSSIITTASTSAGLKERTISITSVTEEDDEPISLLSDRCRYISVSEEEETNRSVITEQPTSSYFPPMDNASASFPTTSATTTTVTAVATASTPKSTTASRSPIPIQILANIGSCSLEKDTDDSDEYRSLEAKDENEFPPMSQD